MAQEREKSSPLDQGIPQGTVASNPAVDAPSSDRLAASLQERPFDLEEWVEGSKLTEETVLYLAYGSNLSKETFRGKRGIKPLAQLNVQVPSLRLTFDLPGLPYDEPCFANTSRRDSDTASQSPPQVRGDENTPLLRLGENPGRYRKDRWHKGLVGVVYEVTAQDYAHIIATEGGGSSYRDILVDCHPFESKDPTDSVPQYPTTSPFKAHTLFAPAATSDLDSPKTADRLSRPDTSYAQASARYLKLLTDGADELGLPYEYQDYLRSLRPYTITSARQRVGHFVFLALWGPIVGLVFTLGRLFVDDKGRMPKWMQQFMAAMFQAMWNNYDSFFKPTFGDGERSISDGGYPGRGDTRAGLSKARRKGNEALIDLEKLDLT